MPSLVLIRGLPGSGKTTLAKKFAQLGYLHAEADMFFIRDGVYKFDQANLGMAHNYCRMFVESALALGYNVVVSNTFVSDYSISEYQRIADGLEATFRVIRCADRHESIHNVPDETMQNMHDRFVDYPGEIIYGDLGNLTLTAEKMLKNFKPLGRIK